MAQGSFFSGRSHRSNTLSRDRLSGSCIVDEDDHVTDALSFSLRLEEDLFISVLSFAISGERYQLCSRIQGEETHCREQILLCRRYQRDFQLAYPIGLFRSPRFFNQHPHRAEDGPLLFQLSEVERVFRERINTPRVSKLFLFQILIVSRGRINFRKYRRYLVFEGEERGEGGSNIC